MVSLIVGSIRDLSLSEPINSTIAGKGCVMSSLAYSVPSVDAYHVMVSPWIRGSDSIIILVAFRVPRPMFIILTWSCTRAWTSFSLFCNWVSFALSVLIRCT
jgi:hypothetical protein